MAKKKPTLPAVSKKTFTEEKFIQDVLTRGEAVKRDINGNLPPGATHEIIAQKPGKLPEVKRVRFSVA